MDGRRRWRLAGIGWAIALLAAWAIYLAFFLRRLNGHSHPIGEDYSYFLPRLLATAAWFKVNGWFSIPWFMPAFCGGMPFWPNPQAIPYSLPQLLTVWMDPVRAIQTSFAVFALFGGTGTWVLLRRSFHASRIASLLGAVLFLYNSFYSTRMEVGHLAFQPFMLTPWLAWLVLRTGDSRLVLVEGLLAGLLVAFMIESGMVVLLVPVTLACVALAFLSAFSTGASLRGPALRLSIALTAALALSASKIVAGSAFMTQFPRTLPPLAGFRSLAIEIRMLARVFFWRAGPPIHGETGTFHGRPHEWDYGITPVAGVLMLLGIFRWWKPIRLGRGAALAGMIATLSIPLVINLAIPGWGQLARSVPVLRWNSTLFRWYMLYLPVIAVMAALALDGLPWRAVLGGASVGIAIAWSLWRAAIPPEAATFYDPARIDAGWKVLARTGSLPAIATLQMVADAAGNPTRPIGCDDVITGGISQAFCYEPIYGYDLKALPWHQLRPGPVLAVRDGALNLRNPACDVFPGSNHCAPGDRLAASRREEAEAFLDWKPLSFARPRRQRLADALNLAALLLVPAGLLFATFRRRRSRLAASRSL